MTETIESGASLAVGMIRTFLIADVRGYTRFTVEHGDEAAAKLATRFAALTRSIVSVHQGQVIELRGDEALAVFVSARQALRAAMGLKEIFAQETMAGTTQPLKVGIGLDVGEAVPVEGGYRGGALNLAARLCSLAGPGEILVSEGVTHLARKMGEFHYSDRGAVEFKGFDDPVRVVEVLPVSQQEQTSTEPIAESSEPASRELPIGSYLGSLPANRVIGRRPEVNHALEMTEEVVKGKGRLLLLVGEPGAGKTRLAQEITLHLRNRGFLIAAGRCYEPQQTVPFYPFIEALTRLYAASPISVRQAVPQKWANLAHLMPALDLHMENSPGLQDQQRLFWAVTGFIQAIARTAPVALLLDDLHWADAASLELLQHLARHSHTDRVLLLGTYRDVEVNRQHPLEAALRDLQHEGLVERIEVRRLGREETRELIASVLGEQEISDEFAVLIHRRTEGNAFFVQQVLRAMVERGDVFRKGDRWDRKTIEDIEVPESVRSVVGQRLSRLAEQTQELLREASVLGQAFSFDDLQSMSGRTEHDMESALDEAIAAGMIRESGGDQYGFDHALTQGALCAELSSRRRRRLHLASGEAIEALPERRREGRAGELAWHFLEGDDAERALHWSMIAGDGAESVFAHSDAEYHYRTALQLASEEGNRTQEMNACEKLGGVLSFTAHHDEALQFFEAVAEFYREQADFEGEIRVTAHIGWILFEQGRRDDGIERLLPVLQQWDRDPVISSGAASLHVALSNLYWHAGRLEDALRLAERATELSAMAGDDGLLGMAESRRGVYLDMLGRKDEAVDMYTKAISLLEATGDLKTLAATLNNRALNYDGRGQSAAAWADRERSLGVARRLADPVQIGWSLGALARDGWSIDGDWKRVRPYVEEITRLESQLRGTRSSGFISAAIWLRLVAGNEASALQDLERLAREAESDGDIMLWHWTQFNLAEWDLLQGHEESALARYETLLEYPGGESQYRLIVESGVAEACVSCGQLERAEILVSAYSEQTNRVSATSTRLRWMTTRARLRAAQGRRDEARADFEETMTFARERGRVLNLALAAHAYGEMLVLLGETEAACEHFEEAMSIFRTMSSRLYAERTERALEAISQSRFQRKG